MEKLIEAIKQMQELKGLSDQKFSKEIGLDPSWWSRIKNGKAHPGSKFLRAISRVYPELRLAVHDYMKSEDELIPA